MREFAERVVRDEKLRRHLGIQASFVIDAVWAVANLLLGALEASVWLITLGAYYLVFGIMRAIMLAWLRRPEGRTRAEERSLERTCGILLLASIFVLSGIVTLVMKDEGGFVYDEIVIYAMATFAFYSLAVSVFSNVKSRKRGDVVAVTISRVNLAVALVSIFAVEVAMLSAFGTEEDEALRRIMPILTGTGIAAVVGYLGVRSIAGTDGRRT